MKLSQKHLLLLIALYCLINSSSALAKNKTIKLQGLKLYSQEYLIERLKLNNLPENQNHYKKVSNKIIYFYQRKGYHLAISYLLKENNEELIIFIDEGQLGQIKFINLNAITTVRIRYDFFLKDKIYNKFLVEKELKRIKRKYSFKKIYAKLVKSVNYDNALFQLDNSVPIPYVGEASLPFFEKYGYRYHLELYIYKDPKKTYRGFNYGIKFRKSLGVSPYIGYKHKSLLVDNDRLVARTSMGIMYLMDFQPKNPPYWTYADFTPTYYFKPFFNNYFTPRIRGSIFRSKKSRKDLGLDNYHYLKNRGVIEPGITLLKRLRIYAGLGIEKVYIFGSEIDEDADYIVDIDEHDTYWTFFEFKMEVNSLFNGKINSYIPDIDLRYTFYRNGTSFHEADLSTNKTFKINDFNLYLFKLQMSKLRGEVPFHHEIAVSNATFKGFMGKGYHTHQIARTGNSYRTSIYKDYWFLGVYLDAVSFKGSGYDLDGNQYGVVAGPSLHTIIMDQFQFDLYYGKDYIFDSEESQYNLFFHLYKKW